MGPRWDRSLRRRRGVLVGVRIRGRRCGCALVGVPVLQGAQPARVGPDRLRAEPDLRHGEPREGLC